jgi:precorrin-6A/cobalt-precorrin-6A reductase
LPAPAERILILGGTAEAAKLAVRLVEKGEANVITSLAGRTQHPTTLPGLMRVGGFGGVAGLVAYLQREAITHVYDATHPFASIISKNAIAACGQTGIPLTILKRPAWTKQPDDIWIDVVSEEEAARILPPDATVFLALGRQYVDAFTLRKDCRFILRMVDRPVCNLPFANSEIIIGKAEADGAKEKHLLETHNITHVVARNSGGDAGYGKIIAARELQIPVVMIGRQS